jgi:transcriptional regulator with XRE-family HTH domain
MRAADPDRVLRGVGRRVAELRVLSGRTQEELAERAEFSVKYMQRVEAGQQNLSVRSLVRLANVLGVPAAELFRSPASTAVRTGRPPGRRAGR